MELHGQGYYTFNMTVYDCHSVSQSAWHGYFSQILRILQITISRGHEIRGSHDLTCSHTWCHVSTCTFWHLFQQKLHVSNAQHHYHRWVLLRLHHALFLCLFLLICLNMHMPNNLIQVSQPTNCQSISRYLSITLETVVRVLYFILSICI